MYTDNTFKPQQKYVLSENRNVYKKIDGVNFFLSTTTGGIIGN